jgi:hypothetical protein
VRPDRIPSFGEEPHRMGAGDRTPRLLCKVHGLTAALLLAGAWLAAPAGASRAARRPRSTQPRSPGSSPTRRRRTSPRPARWWRRPPQKRPAPWSVSWLERPTPWPAPAPSPRLPRHSAMRPSLGPRRRSLHSAQARGESHPPLRPAPGKPPDRERVTARQRGRAVAGGGAGRASTCRAGNGQATSRRRFGPCGAESPAEPRAGVQRRLLCLRRLGEPLLRGAGAAPDRALRGRARPSRPPSQPPGRVLAGGLRAVAGAAWLALPGWP